MCVHLYYVNIDDAALFPQYAQNFRRNLAYLITGNILPYTYLISSVGRILYFQSYSGESKSLNTGIVTVKNYGAEVASVVTQVTFAHEIGHNFGSEVEFCFEF